MVEVEHLLSRRFWDKQVLLVVAFWHTDLLVFTFWHANSFNKCFLTLWPNPMLLPHASMYVLVLMSITYRCLAFGRWYSINISLMSYLNWLALAEKQVLNYLQNVNLVETLVEECFWQTHARQKMKYVTKWYELSMITWPINEWVYLLLICRENGNINYI